MKIEVIEYTLILRNLEKQDIDFTNVIKDPLSIQSIVLEGMFVESLDLRCFRNLKYLRIQDSIIDNIFLNPFVKIGYLLLCESHVEKFESIDFYENAQLIMIMSVIINFPQIKLLNQQNILSVESLINNELNQETIKFVERLQNLKISRISKDKNLKDNIQVWNPKTRTLFFYPSVNAKVIEYNWNKYCSEAKNIVSLSCNVEFMGDFSSCKNIESLFVIDEDAEERDLLLNTKNNFKNLVLVQSKFQTIDVLDLNYQDNGILIIDKVIGLDLFIKNNFDHNIALVANEIKYIDFPSGEIGYRIVKKKTKKSIKEFVKNVQNHLLNWESSLNKKKS